MHGYNVHKHTMYAQERFYVARTTAYGISMRVKKPTAQNRPTDALCSLQPHARAPQVANRQFAVAKQICLGSMCQKNCTIAAPAQRQPITLDVQCHREATSVRDVLLRINEYVDGVLLDPLPCAVVFAALPEVVRRHDHGTRIDMQSVAPIVALRLCHLKSFEVVVGQPETELG